MSVQLHDPRRKYLIMMMPKWMLREATCARQKQRRGTRPSAALHQLVSTACIGLVDQCLTDQLSDLLRDIPIIMPDLGLVTSLFSTLLFSRSSPPSPH
eukprot:UN1887